MEQVFEDRRRAKSDVPRPSVPRFIKISHTLEVVLAEHLEEFAFRQRISESSVIEFALRLFFGKRGDEKLGKSLRLNRAGRRRKSNAVL